MNPRILSGAVLVIGGVILFMVGMNASDSFADQWSSFFTGHFTDRTVWYMVVGAVATVAGLLMATMGGRWRTA